MNNFYSRYIILLPIFVLLQILILNEILFFNYINPFLYLTLIISLPLKTPKWILLVYAFSLGFFIDLFSGSLGFHSTASVFIAFIKPTIVKITIPYNTLEDTDEINLEKIGSKSFTVFSTILILFHNSILFILEHLHRNLHIQVKILASSLMTLVLILVLEILKSSKK